MPSGPEFSFEISNLGQLSKYELLQLGSKLFGYKYRYKRAVHIALCLSCAMGAFLILDFACGWGNTAIHR